ncbi:hypothetical protein M569_13651, partial [Genlisea aurea]
GILPEDLGFIPYLKSIDLSGNFFNGSLPWSLFNSSVIEDVNLADNAISGRIPEGLEGGGNLRVLNLSDNALTGNIPANLGLLRNLTVVSVRNNYLSGEIPAGFLRAEFLDFSANFFNGSLPRGLLGGEELRYLNLSHNRISGPVSISFAGRVPASAAVDLSFNILSGKIPENSSLSAQKSEAFIGNPDLCGKPLKKLCSVPSTLSVPVNITVGANITTSPAAIAAIPRIISPENADTSETTFSDENETHDQNQNRIKPIKECKNHKSLIMVDGETQLQLETLLTASAFVLGSHGDSIVYKAVLADGTSFAVRRIGENGMGEMKIFEQQVRSLAKLRHENVVRVRGFYWGDDEKLIVHDYISSCSLANISYRRTSGSSPYLLSFGNRVKIGRGVARGLKYIHDKKFVHGNIKPTNILLTQDMEPMIADLGVIRLVHGNNTLDASSGHFGSRRRSISGGEQRQCTSPYHAPESFKNLKPNPKWDVFSFGIVLLELLTGRVFSDGDVGEWDGDAIGDDRSWALRMIDGAVRGEAAAAEESLSDLLHLGFRCASLVPHKRPCMKEA